MATRKFKVVLLGEGRVGKTSILLRYIKGEYDERQVSTLQASYLDKKLMVDNARVQLSLWDTAGQERFHALGPIYYRDADGALLVYDITDEESFKKVRTWVKELRRIVGEDIDICIAGNKSDLQRNRKVSEEEASRYAASVGATHYTTSAKLNRGLEDVFVELTKRMLVRTSTKKKKSALIADEEEEDEVLPPRSAPSSRPTSRSVGGHGRRSEATGGSKGTGPGSAPGMRHTTGRMGGRADRGGLPPVVLGGEEGYGEEEDDPMGAPSRMTDGVRIRGVNHQHSQLEATKAKSGCC